MPRILPRIFLWTAAAAALAAGAGTVAGLPFAFDPGPDHPGWVARYGELAGVLGDTPRAFFVADDPEGTPKYKLFRAQFVLGPTVFQDRSSIEKVRPGLLVSVPLLVDGSSTQSLDRILARLRERAAAERVELIVDRYPRGLAVVRARGVGG